MSIWNAIILGLVQGLTEILPISSSGHLIILKEFFGIGFQEGGILFDILLHMGVLLALLLAFYRDIFRLVSEGIFLVRDILVNLGRWIQNRLGGKRGYRRLIRNSYRKYLLLLLLSWIPAVILDVLLGNMAELAQQIVLVPALCLIVTSLFLFIADSVEVGSRKPKDASVFHGVCVGAAQGLGVLPGVSRSGAGLTAGLLCGFEPRFAVRYSFVMSIPMIAGGMIRDWLGAGGISIASRELKPALIAMAVAAAASYLAICLLLAMARKRCYKWFAIYCGALGTAVTIHYFLI